MLGVSIERREGTMAEVILFHHALGVTDGLRAFADQLRDRDHKVTVADLFGGTTFATIDEGVAYEEKLGWDEMIERSEAAIAPLPPKVVVGGFSLGAVYGLRLAQTRPGVLGALLYHGGDEAFDVPWPDGVGLQIHVSAGDKWFNREGGEQLVSEVPGAELFLYPGSGHLFTDSSWEEYDEESTTLVVDRTLAFLDRVG
jgi:dienelactone hydrolase